MPAGQRGPLSTRRTVADGGGIFTETFSFCFRFHEIIPQSAYGCQLSTRHALRVPFQGSLFSTPFLPPLNLPPLKREGDRRRRWRDSTEIFSFCFRFHEIIPQSAYGCQLPFQGSHFTFFNDTQDIRRFVLLFFLQYTGTNHQNVCQFHHLKIG